LSNRVDGQPTNAVVRTTAAFPWRGALIVVGILLAVLAWTSLRMVETTALWSWAQVAIFLGLGCAVLGLALVLQQRQRAMRGLDPLLANGRRVYLVPGLIVLVLLSLVVSLLPLPPSLVWVSTLLPILMLGLAIWMGFRLFRSVPPQSYLAAQRAYEEGRLDDALAELNTILNKQPDYYPAIHLRAVIYRQKSQYQAAYADAERLIALRPDLYYGHAEMGLTLLEDGQSPRACESLSLAAGLAPGLAEGHLNLGLARVEAQEYHGAVQSLAQALRMGLSDSVVQVMARYGLVVSFQALGDQQQAAREWRRLRRLRGVLKGWRRELTERPGPARSHRKELAMLAAVERAIVQRPERD